MPDVARDLSRGCGNPTGFAHLAPGESVVDFGCGGGIDVILAARKVGEEGRVVGIDLSPQMIERAGQAIAEVGLDGGSIELRIADLARTELPAGGADVVTSNCVINLCPDKAAVYEEACRILRPGGRLAISDVVLTEPIGPELRARLQESWSGCLGARSPRTSTGKSWGGRVSRMSGWFPVTPCPRWNWRRWPVVPARRSHPRRGRKTGFRWRGRCPVSSSQQ